MSALDRAIALIQQPIHLVPGDHVLVLFDPDGSACSDIRKQGFNPVCVPDRQSGIKPGLTHETLESNLIVELLQREQSFKLAVATHGLARYLDVSKPHEQSDLVQWLKANVMITVMGAPHTEPWLVANQLGPYRIRSPLSDFTYLAEIDSADPQPLIALSDHFLWAGHKWYAGTELRGLGAKIRSTGPFVRTFKSVDNTLIKYEITSPDYFDRSQVLGEANFLTEVPQEMVEELQLPSLSSRIDGRAVVTLTREFISGGEIGGHAPMQPEEKTIALISLASSFAKYGYFHNDIRPWNIIWSAGKPAFIDFADASSEDLDVQGIPNIAALFGIILWLSELTPPGFALDDSPEFVDQLIDLLAAIGVTDLNDEHGELARAWLELPARIAQLNEVGRSPFTHLTLWGFLSEELCEGIND